MKEIKLTQGKVTLVDDEDYEWLSEYKWCASYNIFTKDFVAIRKSKINGERKTILLHRVIMDAPDNKLVDHRNHDTLDNQRYNLRTCTHSENARNRKGADRDSISGYLGVGWSKQSKKWTAHVKINKKVRYLGLFNNKIEAAIARDEVAIELHGEFAYLNFPQEELLRKNGI